MLTSPTVVLLNSVVFFIDLGSSGNALEIGSGTGQHIVHFAKYFVKWQWQPSDIEQGYLESISYHIHEARLGNIDQPLVIDVTKSTNNWDIKIEREYFDLILNINMVHITPFECAVGLFSIAGKLLKIGSKLVMYGPFAINGVLSPESNIRFDKILKNENNSWGIRDIKEMEQLAYNNHLKLVEQLDVPSNNKILVFVKQGST